MNNDWINKGNQFYKDGLYKDAVQCYDQAIKIDSNSAGVWNNKGLSLDNLGHHEEAIQCYSKALKITPQNIHAWCNLGISLDAMNQSEKALTCFDEALRFNSKHILSWQKKGDSLHNLGRDKEAVYCYEQVLKFAYNESNLIQNATARLAELKRDINPSVNQEEYTVSQNPQKDREPINQPADVTYHPGDVIGQKYEVRSVLGSGGFGVVYLVFNGETLESHALKTFHNKSLNDAKIRDLFKKEANILVELGRHPYLVRTYFVDEVLGRLFIGMEYIAPNKQGINSLDGYLQNRPLDLTQSLRWAIQICFGMEYAYSKGIRAHRDLKLENIMVSKDGTAKITDFGLAGIEDALPTNSASLTGNVGQLGRTQRGVGFGTSTHMPPEQFDNAASCDQRSDIYAFGVILFQMVSGELPFLAALPRDASHEEGTRFWLDMQQIHNEAPIPRLNSPLFPIIQCCLEKKPDKRYQSFARLRLDLEPILKQQGGEVIRQPKLGELDTWAWTNKGYSLQALGHDEEAIRCYDKALEIDSRYVVALNNKGLSLYNLRRYEEATRYYDISLEIEPRYVHALNNKGRVFAKLGRHEEAILYFDKTLAVDSRYVAALFNKGDSLDSLGRHEEAILYFDKTLAVDSQYTPALINKGDTLGKMGLYEESGRCIDQALKIDPLDVVSLGSKGNNLYSMNRYEEAVLYFDKALKIDSRNSGFLNNKGTCLKMLGRYKEAIRCFDLILEIAPRSIDALFNKANTLDILGQKRDAVRSYRQFLALTPNPAQYTNFINHARQRIQKLDGK